MPQGPPSNPGGTTSFKTLDVIRMAMQEIGVLDPQEVPSASEAETGLAKLNRMLDSWDADHRYIFEHFFFVGTITPLLQPHLIGPSGTPGFVMDQRPVQLEGANILLNAGPGPSFISNSTVRVRVSVHQDYGAWWESQLAPGIQSVIPTDVYYQPGWPNGSLFLWVVPTVAYPFELQLWRPLAQLALTDQFSLPPGYLDAVVYSLAESISPSFGVPVSPDLLRLKAVALKRVEGPNLIAPHLGTRDAGIPSAHAGNRSTYNYLTKQNNT